MNSVHEGVQMKGEYIITLANVQSLAARNLEKVIAESRDSIFPDFERTGGLMAELNRRFGKVVQRVPNLIPTVGRAVLASRLANLTTYTGIINKIALGAGSTTPTNSDVQLSSETYRNSVASLSNSSNVAYVSGFFTAAETNGTYNECGIFIDGAAGANTGQLFSHALIGVTKSSIQTLTVDWILTIS